ncbi:MAG: hypothetical protein WCO18_00670, partial [bacterium]
MDSIILKANALIVNPIIILMFSFALVGFLWGVMGYINHADDLEARAKGTQHMLWGLVGMTIMISTFAIMRLVLRTFGLNSGDTQTAVEKV